MLLAAGEVATKAGLDCGGEVVTASTRTYVPEKKAETTVTNFLKKYIPESCDEVDFTKTCLYCLTPDRHFIIDKVPLRRVENSDLPLPLPYTSPFSDACLPSGVGVRRCRPRLQVGVPHRSHFGPDRRQRPDHLPY